jgi:flagellar biosynthesis protein FlhB
MEKTEFPTPEKLEELRQRGITPVSHQSLRLFVVAGVMIFVGIFGPRMLTIIAQTLTDLSLTSGASPELSSVWKFSVFLLLALFLPVALTIIVGLFQSRFTLKFSYTHGSKPANLTALESLGRRIRAAFFFSIACPLIGILFALGAAYLIWPEILKLYVLNTASVGPAIKKLHYLIFIGGGVLAACIAITVWLVGRYRFMLVHRMTRAEVNNKEKE